MKKLENVDLFEVLGNIVNENTEYYKSDFEHDKRWLKEATQKENSEDRIFCWLSRSHGTHLLNEREVFIKNAPENITFLHWYAEKEPSVKAYAVTVTGETDGRVTGNVYELDYPQICEYIKENAVVADKKTMYYENGSVEVASNNYDNLASHPDFGRYVGYELIPNKPEHLKELLKTVRAERGQKTTEQEQSEKVPEEQTTPETVVNETEETKINAADFADIGNTPDSTATDTPMEEKTSKPIYHTINENMAKRANDMNSYYDYRQGFATASYRAEVDKAVEIAEKQKKRVDPQFHDKIDGLLASYCKKLAANINKGLEIETRCPSWLVTGGSDFPVRKKEKQNAARETNRREYQDIQGLLDKIKSVGMGGISADDPNAIEKLESKLAKLEAYHQKVKTVNAYFRKHKTVEGCPELTAEEIEKMTAVINSDRSMYKMPYPPYELQYNNAEMRRLKQRIEILKARDNTNFVGWEFDGGKVEPNTADNRLQVYFNDKPSEEIREELKKNGFKWSPKAQAWQKQLKKHLYWDCDRIECIKPLCAKLPSEILKEANAPQKEQAAEKVTEQSENFISKLLDNAEIEFTHFTSKEQFDKWVDEHGKPQKPEKPSVVKRLAEEKAKVKNAQPPEKAIKKKHQNLEVE